MAAEEGTIHEKIGELRGEVTGLVRAIGEMREDNAADHAAVIRKITSLEKKVDALESDRDRKVGRTAFVNGIALGIASLAGAVFGSHT